ncbi:hypothetical protein A2U01_0004846, partial [Trifolium medium]|nr:hypothetical protein [Trifolium medium]
TNRARVTTEHGSRLQRVGTILKAILRPNDHHETENQQPLRRKKNRLPSQRPAKQKWRNNPYGGGDAEVKAPSSHHQRSWLHLEVLTAASQNDRSKHTRDGVEDEDYFRSLRLC